MPCRILRRQPQGHSPITPDSSPKSKAKHDGFRAVPSDASKEEKPKKKQMPKVCTYMCVEQTHLNTTRLPLPRPLRLSLSLTQYGGATSWVTSGTSTMPPTHVVSMLETKSKPRPEPINKGETTTARPISPLNEKAVLKPAADKAADKAAEKAAGKAAEPTTKSPRESDPKDSHFSR